MNAAIGEIYIYKVPFIDSPKKSKARPVLIIGTKKENGNILAIVGTSKLYNSSDEISFILTPDDIDECLLEVNTVFSISKRLLISSEFLIKKVGVLKKEKIKEVLKSIFFIHTMDYYNAVHKPEQCEVFIPSKSRVNYAGRVFDEKEMINLIDSSLDFWLTYGKYSKEFEKKLAEFLGSKYAFLVNSGSSANLLAFMALTSPLLGYRKINRGDEIITVAAGFPTTVAPIIQYGAVPVFVDVELGTYNINVKQLELALSNKTKAVMLAHTLGNPFNLKEVKDFCNKNNLWLIEDNCDSLGAKYFIDGEWKYTGTIGDIGTSSFYPPHHMTMGEGGAVYTNNSLLKKIILSMRDWGRDCWCDSGVDNTCKSRFTGQFGTLPYGYDHKYVYSHFGYNLKVSDMQAAVGCAQLEKFPEFIQVRKHNFDYLKNGLKGLMDYFILPEPTENSDPSWFGFMITLKNNLNFKRNDIVEYLEKNNIQTRNLFAGNITRHPCFSELQINKDYRIAIELKNTDIIMNDSFLVGVYPGMNEDKLQYIIEQIKEFLAGI